MLSRASSAALTTPVPARSDCNAPPMSRPIESPTINTRKGWAPVGIFGFGGAVVGVVGAVRPACAGAVPPPCRVPFVPSACGPETVSPTAPPATLVSRPVADTRRESCSPRLSAATGPVMSRLTVRRVPTGDTWALCCSVGAKSEKPQCERPRAEREDARPGHPHASVVGRRRLGLPGRAALALLGRGRARFRGLLPVDVVPWCALIRHQKR